MARTWLSVTVELLGGRGEEFWPPPGRVFAVGPSHTFMDLADAINGGFGRWDRAHLSVFTLSDGRVVTDAETGAEVVSSVGGPMASVLDIQAAKVARVVQPTDEFQYIFDVGDDWIHRCVVGDERIEPLDVLGVRPDRPLPYWGWGDLPDQYGRRWADDDGEGGPPRRPTEPHPMFARTWPARDVVPEIDLTEVRSAIAVADADRFLTAITGRQVDDVLQQVGAGIALALEQRREQAEDIALSLINRLTLRACTGDEVLADDLLARLRGEPLSGREVEIDLGELCAHMETDPAMSMGGYIDLQTGDVYDESATDPMMVGEDAAVDVEQEPDRWLWFDCGHSRDGWRDMADFAAAQRDPSFRQRLERAIEGKGAFGRFRAVVHEEDLAVHWHAYAADRQWGRARDFLAGHGIRVG